MPIFLKSIPAFFFLSFLFLSPFSHAQKPLSLEDAIKMGLKNNFQIEIAERNLEIATNNNDWKNTNRYPRIDFNANAQNSASRVTPAISFIDGSYNSQASRIGASLDLNWTLFDGHSARINKTRFEELERQGQSSLAVQVETAVRNIILNYYNVLINTEQLKVVQEVLTLSRDRIKYQEIRREFGQAGRFDILQSQDAYLNDSTNYLVQQNSYETAMRNLLLAIGEKDLNKKYEITDRLTYQAQSYSYEDLRRKMMANNTELLNLMVNRNLARIEKDVQKTGKKPSLNLGAGIAPTLDLQNSDALFMGTPFGFQAGNDLTGYINLSLNVPLYDAGQNRRNVENAEIQENIAELQIEDLQRTLSYTLKNTIETYNNQRRLVKLTEELIENARENLDIADEQFKNGAINSFDYRSIQVSFINASQARLSAIFNLKNTETELIRLIGGLVR